MTLVSESERAQAVADVRAIILAAVQQALVSRALPGERLYGTDEVEYAAVGAIPVEWVATPADTLGQSIDGTASVLPDADVQPHDRLLFDGTTYRVQSVRTVNWFGAITHKVLSLVKLHGC